MEVVNGGSMSAGCAAAILGMGVAIAGGFFTGGVATLIYFNVALAAGGAGILTSCTAE
jgi:hypothetical protein